MKMVGTSSEDQQTSLIISRITVLKTRNVSDKRCRENRNTHFVFSNFFSKIMPFMRYRVKIE